MVISWSGHRMTDPAELASRFSIEDGMAYVDSIFEGPSEEAKQKIERVREIMEFLPACEADFVDLYYFRGLKQTEIAEIFRVSQPTVCYRLKRATSRILYLLELPDIDPDELRHDMTRLLDDPKDVEIMVLMYKTRCQSVVAKILGVSQGLVRHRFIRSLKKMEEEGDEYLPYMTLFDYIAANMNVLREVQHPRDESAVMYVIC